MYGVFYLKPKPYKYAKSYYWLNIITRKAPRLAPRLNGREDLTVKLLFILRFFCYLRVEVLACRVQGTIIDSLWY